MSITILEAGRGKYGGEHRFYVGSKRFPYTKRLLGKSIIIYPKLRMISIPMRYSDNKLIIELKLVQMHTLFTSHIYEYSEELFPFMGAVCMGARIKDVLREYLKK